MTEDDQQKEIGRLFLERQQVRQEFSCLHKKLQQLAEPWRVLGAVMQGLEDDFQWQIERDGDAVRVLVGDLGREVALVPSLSEVAVLLEERRQLRRRLAELDDLCAKYS